MRIRFSRLDEPLQPSARLWALCQAHTLASIRHPHGKLDDLLVSNAGDLLVSAARAEAGDSEREQAVDTGPWTPYDPERPTMEPDASYDPERPSVALDVD